MNKNQLKAALDQLISSADKQNEAHKSSRDLLYTTLGGVYMWWQEASQIEDFLEDLYKERRLKMRGNEENFTRLIRLVWQMEWSGRIGPKLQLWSNALRKIDKEYKSNKEAYAKDPAERIAQFLRSKGGIRGLLGIDQQYGFAEDGKHNTKSTRKNDDKNNLDIASKHLSLGEHYFANDAKSIINIASGSRSLYVTRKGYAVALLRQSSNSKYQILSVTNNDHIVNDTIIDTYKRNAGGTPEVLKVLGEIIQTQSLPLALERHRAILSEKSAVADAEGKKMKQLKRLLIRSKQKDVLLSENRSNCSVVTVAVPNVRLLSDAEDVFLRITNHRFIENEIVQERNLCFFTTLKSRITALKDTELKASHLLAVKNTVTSKITNLYFYRKTALEKPSQIQAKIDLKATTPVWRATMNEEWLRSLDTVFLSNWLCSYGVHINREEYKVLQLCFGKQSLSIKQRGENGQFTELETCVTVPNIDSKSKPLNVNFLAKDIIPVLNALVTQEITSSVRFMASAELLAIFYRTELAQYGIGIPPSTVRGKRIGSAFSGYGA